MPAAAYANLAWNGPGSAAVVDVSASTVTADVQGWAKAQGSAAGAGSIPAAHVTGLKNSPMTTAGLGQIVTAYPRGRARPTLTVSIGSRPSAEDVAQAVWGMENGIETGWTPRQIMRIVAAVLAGKVSGAGSNAPVFRGITDAKPRVEATTDASGNRTAVSTDPD